MFYDNAWNSYNISPLMWVWHKPPEQRMLAGHCRRKGPSVISDGGVGGGDEDVHCYPDRWNVNHPTLYPCSLGLAITCPQPSLQAPGQPVWPCHELWPASLSPMEGWLLFVQPLQTSSCPEALVNISVVWWLNYTSSMNSPFLAALSES